jgi:hypothetical protein
MWRLSLEKKKADNILPDTRNVVVQWWREETRVSSNKSEVTRKRLGPIIYDEKTNHFLMET